MELVPEFRGYDYFVLGDEIVIVDPSTRRVVDVARLHAGGRFVSVMEGGYNVPILAGCVAAHLEALGATPTPGGSS